MIRQDRERDDDDDDYYSSLEESGFVQRIHLNESV